MSYSCDVCNKSFNKKSHFVAHQMIHTGEKPFSCEMCDKRFLRIGGLNSHKLTHSSESLFLCKLCGQTFRNINNLNTHHKRKHVKKKPHSCDTCEKTFALPCDLRLHQRTHTGERPYCCAECGQTFKHGSNLARHKKRFHSSITEVINCDLCSESFQDKTSLNKHILSHIKDDVNVKLKNLHAELVNGEWVLSKCNCNWFTKMFVQCFDDIKDEKDIKDDVYDYKTVTVDFVANPLMIKDII